MTDWQTEAKALERRVNKLENLVWVVGAVAAALGIGTGPLLDRIYTAKVVHEQRIGEIKTLANGLKGELTNHGKDLTHQLHTSASAEQTRIFTALEREGDRIRRSLAPGTIPGWRVAYCVLTRGQVSQSWREWTVDGDQAGPDARDSKLVAIKIKLFREGSSAPTGSCG